MQPSVLSFTTALAVLRRVLISTSILFIATNCSGQIKLNSSTAPTQGQAGLNLVSVTGSGFPTGTILPGNVTVALSPAPPAAGASATTKATAIQTIIGSTRRVQFLIPASLVTNASTPYLVYISGTTSAAVNFSSTNAATLQIIPPPVISLNPSSGQPGTAFSVQISVTNTGAGANAGFAQGSTVANFGAGTSVAGVAAGTLGPVTVTGPNTASAQVTIAAGATGGSQQVLVETGSEELYSTFTINGAGPPAKLVFTTQPTSINAGQSLPAVQVSIEDALGNVERNASNPITIALGNNPGSDVLSGTLTENAVNGVATFAGLGLRKAGTGYTLVATGSGFTAISNSFNVNAGPAALLVFTSEPASVPTGKTLPAVQVTAEDASGNVVANPSLVTIAISANPGGSTLSGTLTENTAAGVATFADLSLNLPGTGYTLSASTLGATTATSSPFDVTALVPAVLSFTQPPGNVQTGQTFLPAVQVTVKNASGAVVTGFNGPVTLSIGNNPSGATLAGTATQNAVNGVATFPGLSLNTAGKGYTLVAAGTGLTATSNLFNVTVSPQLASCVATSSLSVQLQGTNVNSYVPNGNWEIGTKNVQFVPIEGTASLATIATPNVVNSCASNWLTGQTVCTANNTDVYLITGSSLDTTLTSGSNNITTFSGGTCENCGVAINPTTNQAVIALGLSAAGSTATAGIQLLDLNNNTFASPIPTSGVGISEDVVVDPMRNLVLSPSENGVYEVFRLGSHPGVFDNTPATLSSKFLDSAAEDCTTGIALSSEEDSAAIFIADLTQASFDSNTLPVPTWVAPEQNQIFPEFGALGAGTSGIAVAPGSHLGIVTGEFGGNAFGVFQLPSTSGNGTPAILDYVVASIPTDPNGNQWNSGNDPHPLTAYVSPNDGKAYGLTAGFPPRFLAIVDLQGVLRAPRSAAHAVDPGIDLGVAGLVRFVPVYAFHSTQLVFITQPGNGTAGINLPTFQVAFEDAMGNLNINANATVTITLNGGTFSGGATSITAGAQNGIATFSSDQILTAGTYTLTATASGTGLPGTTSNSFIVSPNVPAQLLFIAQPANITAGQSLPNVQVAIEDLFGNLVATTSPVTLTISTGPIGAILAGTTSMIPVNGLATFPGLTIDKPPATYTLLASGVGLSATSASFSVSSGPATHLFFSQQPGNGVAGSTGLSAQVILEDAFGNVVPSNATAVTLALGSNPGGSTLSGFLTVNTLNGVAGFAGLSLNFAGAGYTFIASSPGLPSLTSNPFNVTGAGPPAQLAFTIQPSNSTAGQSIPVQVSIEDAQGNVVPSANGTSVTLALGSNPGSATLLGFLSTTTSLGVANLSVQLNKIGIGYNLIASSTGLTPATSAAFNIAPAAASQLVFVNQPTSFAAGGAMPMVQVAVEDNFGNLISNAANQVSMLIFQNPSGGTLSGTLSVTPSNGVASFSNLSIDKTGNSYALGATYPGLAAIVSNPFNVLPPGTPVPTTIQVKLSDNLVAPDESIAVSPQVLDQNGNVINDPSLQFTIGIKANGVTTGNAPVISGTQITFPRVIKRLLNQNLAIDPNGLYADADPTDPNYGKETGGFYSVTASLVGTSLIGSANVTVLPTGTAVATLKAKKYADQLQKVLSEGTTALQNDDLTAIAQTEADINLINGNTSFSSQVLGGNNVIAPPNGYPVTVAQLQGAGFAANPDDALLGSTLSTLANQIQQAITRVNQVNPAALTQSDITDLQAIASSYKTISQQLNALNPSTIGVTLQGALYNTLLRVQLPQLLDAVRILSNGILQQVAPFTLAGWPGKSMPQGNVCPRQPQRQVRLQPARFVLNLGAQRSVYQKPYQSRLRKVQLLDFFFTVFGIVTDLEGTALTNIITLSISLANDLANIGVAGLINSGVRGSLTIDTVQASASLSFVCPNYPGTLVEGLDYSLNPTSMKTAVIGCVNAAAIASLVTLSPAKDLAAAIRLIHDVIELTEQLPEAFNIAAVLVPDVVQPGLFDDTELDLVFTNGWPRVNQSDIPCVGLIFVANLEDGGFRATNADFLGVCP
jgi:hypothetical protein